MSLPASGKVVTKYAKVHGVVCQFCAQGIKKNLKKIEGVKAVKVDMSTKIVEVKSEKPIEDKTISKIITDAGFKVVNIGADRKLIGTAQSTTEESEDSKNTHSHKAMHDHGQMKKEKDDKPKK